MALLQHAAVLPLSAEPWERARERFLEGLSEADRNLFRAANLENLYYTSSMGHKRFESGFFRTAQRNLNPFLEAVSDFSAAMDVYVNACPLILAPLWGSIRVVLNLAQRSEKHFEKLTDMFGRIGDILPRLRTYERLFPQDLHLMNLLTNAYLDVIVFCTDVKKLLMKSRPSLATMAALGHSLWKPFKADFDSFLESFRRRQKEIDQQAKVAEMVEAEKFRELQRTALKAVKREKVLAMLSDVDYIRKHKLLQSERHPGTGLWIKTVQSFDEWRKSPTSCCYSIFGIPGSGKTLLASFVADEMSPDFRAPGSDYCIHYCDYSDPRSVDLTKLLGSLVKQLFQNIEISEELQNDVCTLYQNGATLPAYSEIGNLFLRVVKPLRSLFIVLDGIDELERSFQIALLDVVDKLLALDKNVKLLITCRREEPAIRRKLDRYLFLELSPAILADDVRTFVETSVDSRVQSGDLCLENIQLKSEVTKALIDGAKDMFLWVKLQLDELSGLQTESEIRDALVDLPKDVEETYRRIVTRIQESNGGSAKWTTATQVFKWVLTAQRPLTIDELQEAISIRIEQTCLQRDMIPLDSGTKMLESCGNLIRFNRTDSSVELIHETVQKFLIGDQINLLGCSLEEARRYIAGLCITYLLFSDFETQVAVAEHDRLEVDRALFDHSAAINKSYGGMFTRFLQSAAKMSLGALSQINEAGSSSEQPLRLNVPRNQKSPPMDALTTQYRLLQYVSSHWYQHTPAFIDERFDSENKMIWPDPLYETKLYKLVFDRQCLFEFKPWKSITVVASRRFENLDLFRWSIENGHLELLELLTKKIAWAPNDIYMSQLNQLYLHDAIGSRDFGFSGSFFYRNRQANSDLLKLRDETQLYSDLPTLYPLVRACQHDRLDVLKYFSTKESLYESFINPRDGAKLNGRCLYLLASSSLKSLQGHPLLFNDRSNSELREALEHAMRECLTREDCFALSNVLSGLRQVDPKWYKNKGSALESLISSILDSRCCNALLYSCDSTGMRVRELEFWLDLSTVSAQLFRPFTRQLINQLVVREENARTPGYERFQDLLIAAEYLENSSVLRFLRNFADKDDAASQLDYVANFDCKSEAGDLGMLLLFRDVVTLLESSWAQTLQPAELMSMLDSFLYHTFTVGYITPLKDVSEPKWGSALKSAYDNRRQAAMLFDTHVLEQSDAFKGAVRQFCDAHPTYEGSLVTAKEILPKLVRGPVAGVLEDKLCETIDEYPQWLNEVDYSYPIQTPDLGPCQSNFRTMGTRP